VRPVISTGKRLGNSAYANPCRTFRDWRNSGAQGRNRTTDTAIFSRMLYQLSYLGTPATAEVCGAIEAASRGCPARALQFGFVSGAND
jgi:hypothetical protein